MTKITKGSSLVTLINTFITTPETQQEVLDRLVDATDKEIAHLPGFVSANFHTSEDGTRIVNYAQWESQEHFKAMHANPGAAAHIGEIAAIAEFDFNLYDVVAVLPRT
jgi:quinol monooxygenase YgiN